MELDVVRTHRYTHFHGCRYTEVRAEPHANARELWSDASALKHVQTCRPVHASPYDARMHTQDMRFTSSPESLDLREKWMDAQHTGGTGDLEDAADVVNFEEDMALR